MGQYDGVAIVELPSDEAAATFMIGVGSQGNVRSQTMRAFSEAEFSDIVSGLP